MPRRVETRVAAALAAVVVAVAAFDLLLAPDSPPGFIRDEAAFAVNAARLGHRAATLTSNEFRKRTGFRAKVEHALFVENEGTADPLRVLTGLAMQAHALGVLRHYNTDIASATPTRVTTHEDKVFEADAIVLAPGAWATNVTMSPRA